MALVPQEPLTGEGATPIFIVALQSTDAPTKFLAVKVHFSLALIEVFHVAVPLPDEF